MNYRETDPERLRYKAENAVENGLHQIRLIANSHPSIEDLGRLGPLADNVIQHTYLIESVKQPGIQARSQIYQDIGALRRDIGSRLEDQDRFDIRLSARVSKEQLQDCGLDSAILNVLFLLDENELELIINGNSLSISNISSPLELKLELNGRIKPGQGFGLNASPKNYGIVQDNFREIQERATDTLEKLDERDESDRITLFSVGKRYKAASSIIQAGRAIADSHFQTQTK